MTTELWLVSIPVVAIGLFGLYFRSYIAERGKILATKADIDVITQKVETVKSELGILTHRKISLETEKRNTLLELNSTHSKWLNFVLQTTLNNFNESVEVYYPRKNSKIDEYYYDFLMAQSKVEVFFNDDRELLDAMNDIGMDTLKLSHHTNAALDKAEAETQMKEVTETLPMGEAKNLDMKKHFKTLAEISEAYRKEKLDLYKPLAHKKFQFSKLISKKLFDFSK